MTFNRFLQASFLFALSCVASAETVETERTAEQQKALDLYSKLISYRSAVGHKQVLPMATLLAEQFRAGGFPAEDVHLLPVDDTAALVVRFRGTANSSLKPILFMAHMDVVDALPKDWERDPFTLLEEDGYFYGRGTMDNKAGVNNLTTVFLRLKKEGFVPERDLILAFSGDEETTGITIKTLIKDHRELIDAEFAINSDGGGGSLAKGSDSSSRKAKAASFNVQTAEKTYMTFALETKNRGGHSSAPRSDNAIYQLAAALKKLSQFKFPVRSDETTKLYFERSAELQSGQVAKAMKRFAKDPTDQWASDYLAAKPEYVGVTRTTCVATLLEAGHAENALPQSAKATVNCRVWPDESLESVIQHLENAVDDEGVSVSLADGYTSSPPSPLNPLIMSAIESVVHKRHPDIPVIPYMAPYFTDGKFTRGAGIPTYGVGGLFLGSEDARAHGLNERVPVWSFFESQLYWYDLMVTLAGKK